MGDTKIAWATKTWNVGRGCRRTAPEGSNQSGCGDPSGGGCYAERQAARFCGDGLPYAGLVKLTANGPRWTGKTRFVGEQLAAPLRWRDPQRIFVDSMSDMFYGEADVAKQPQRKHLSDLGDGFSNIEIAAVYGVAAACPWHDFLILTKRATRLPVWYAWVAREAAAANGGRGMSVAAFCFAQAQALDPMLVTGRRSKLSRGTAVDAALAAVWPLPNVWMGVSVENQTAAHERIPPLLDIPAAVHFLSVEPLIDRVELHRIQIPNEREGLHFSALQRQHDDCYGTNDGALIDVVIVGCESGHRARHLETSWIRKLRDDCLGAGTKFFLKQAEESEDAAIADCGASSAGPSEPAERKGRRGRGGGTIIERPFLDGHQYLELPELPHG